MVKAVKTKVKVKAKVKPKASAKPGKVKASTGGKPVAKPAGQPGSKPVPAAVARPAAKVVARPVAKPAAKVVAQPRPEPKAVTSSPSKKPFPTPGKPFPPMTPRKPEPGKPASGAIVPPAAAAGRRPLSARLPLGKPVRELVPEPPRLKKSPYGKKELQPLRRALLELRRRMQGAIDRLGNEALRADEPETDADDVADHGSDAFERNMTLGLLETEARTLQQVEEAIEHMETGRYGVCTVCGGGIPLARLEALPFATTCVPCKEKQERRG
jgi:RNA polymerase-binding protein DksA